MHVAVLVRVELIGDVLHFATGARVQLAASFLLNVAPESASLVVAAAAAASGATTAPTLAVRSTGLSRLGQAVGESVGRIGF